MTLKENKFSNIESSLNLGPSLSDSMFAAFSDFIYKHTGIVMRDNKKTLLSNRLRKRLKILKFNSYENLTCFAFEPICQAPFLSLPPEIKELVGSEISAHGHSSNPEFLKSNPFEIIS